MLKSELIYRVTEKQQGLSLEDVDASVNALIERLSGALSEGERIEIRGFGSFTLHYRPPRNAHNPKTGEKVFTEAKYMPHFKVGKEMRERVNQAASASEDKK